MDPTQEQGTNEDAKIGATSEAPKANRLPEIPVPKVATINCLEDLQQVLADHQKWAEAVLDPNAEIASGRANLQGADLRGYDLAGVNLSGANLASANLESCDLEGANLSVANLQGAILACANLRHAKLRRARLEGADLRGADLTGANLTGVDLSKAILKTPEAPSEPEAKPQALDSAQETQPESTIGAEVTDSAESQDSTEALS